MSEPKYLKLPGEIPTRAIFANLFSRGNPLRQCHNLPSAIESIFLQRENRRILLISLFLNFLNRQLFFLRNLKHFLQDFHKSLNNIPPLCSLSPAKNSNQ